VPRNGALPFGPVWFTVPVTPRGMDTGPERLVSGEAVELDIRIARLGSRALALLVDILAQIGLTFILATVLQIGLAVVGGLADGALAVAGIIVLFVVVFVGYPALLETLLGGRTVGKLAMGLRVVRDDGGPIRFRHALTRALVRVALEWPGFVLPPVTWVASLWTMLINPQGKRLGDLMAGTIVIHERTPASWGWVPAMPPALAGWASALDLTGLDDELALAVRHYLARNREIREPFRSRLGYGLASEVAAHTTPPPPPGTPGWAYLAAVLAERNRRAVRRLVQARRATAAVWPELSREIHGPARPMMVMPAPFPIPRQPTGPPGPPPIRPAMPR
jgi:uncharacterized RDD family membrane protein YckC